jgi:hypothetical protein
MKKITLSLSSMLLLLLAESSSRAQNFIIDWFSINSGGGASSGGSFELSATIGEVGAGSLSGGQFSLDAGYWSIETVQPASNPPLLTITPTDTNTVVVSWPSPSTSFSLQQTTDLNSTSWSDVSAIPNDDGTIKSIIFPLTSGNLFLRLKR